MSQNIEIIGYDCGWGCQDYGCEDGPDALDANLICSNLEKIGHSVRWHAALNIKSIKKRDELTDKETSLPLVVEASERLATAVAHSIDNNHIPVVIGGDHTAAVGTWSSVIAANNSFKEFGLIWLDAHMDAHTPDTAHQGKWGGWWHGMPVACLAGEGVSDLAKFIDDRPKIDLKHFSLLGARSYEQGEDEFMQRHSAHIYKMPDIEKHGFESLFIKSLEIATANTKGFGLSIDLDGFDPDDAPGVGTNEKNGLKASDVLPAIRGLSSHPLFCGIEIVEYNPHNDKDGKTAELINKILLSVFAQD